LEYVRGLSDVDPRVLSDFVTVAARLILIKSHAILPEFKLTEEEEEDIHDLEHRLKLYKEFRAVEANIAEGWQKSTAFTRDYLKELPPGFYLTEKVSARDLHAQIHRFYEELQSFIPKTEEGKLKLVSLEEKIEEMIERVDKAMSASFNDMAKGREKSEIIVMFLALLHLLKDSLVNIKQDELFSEIQISK